VGGRGGRRLVARRGIAVDCIDPPVSPDHLGERDRHVPSAGADVDAPPAALDAEAVEGGGERAAVDVVAQPLEGRHWSIGVRRACIVAPYAAPSVAPGAAR